MARVLEEIEWEGCLVQARPDPALAHYARARMGVVPGGVPYFAPVPWVAKVAIDLHSEFGMLMHLDQQTADILALVVSQENSCRFCYAASRAMLWLQGMDRERIRRIEREAERADLSPRVRAAIDYARSQSRGGPAGARSGWQALRRSGHSADELREIAFVVAATDVQNRLHTIPAIPSLPMERMPRQWHSRLLRPLIDRFIRKHHARGRQVPPPAPSAYPFAGLVAAYAGSPIATALHQILQQMWASDVLTQRCKLLLLAVVARGLPCDVCELEMARLLDDEGLPRAVQMQVLTRLDAPELTDTERLLVPFASETIWFEPAVLQRRARRLREQLGDDARFLEAAGVVAMANGLSRMAATVRDNPA